MLDEALEKNELFEFLTGQKEYSKPSPYDDFSVDTNNIFNQFRSYYLRTKDEKIWDYYRVSILLISKSPSFANLSLYYVYDYLSFCKSADLVFIDLHSFIKEITESLLTNEDLLCKDFSLIGKKFANGLWGDVVRMSQILNRCFGLDMRINSVDFSRGKFETPFELPSYIHDFIEYDGSNIKVVPVLYDDWNFYLLKDVIEDEYYVDIMMNNSAAYWSEVFKISNDIKAELKDAIKKMDKARIILMVQNIKGPALSKALRNTHKK